LIRSTRPRRRRVPRGGGAEPTREGSPPRGHHHLVTIGFVESYRVPLAETARPLQHLPETDVVDALVHERSKEAPALDDFDGGRAGTALEEFLGKRDVDVVGASSSAASFRSVSRRVISLVLVDAPYRRQFEQRPVGRIEQVARSMMPRKAAPRHRRRARSCDGGWVITRPLSESGAFGPNRISGRDHEVHAPPPLEHWRSRRRASERPPRRPSGSQRLQNRCVAQDTGRAARPHPRRSPGFSRVEQTASTTCGNSAPTETTGAIGSA